jgi:hypothetical protein
VVPVFAALFPRHIFTASTANPPPQVVLAITVVRVARQMGHME